MNPVKVYIRLDADDESLEDGIFLGKAKKSGVSSIPPSIRQEKSRKNHSGTVESGGALNERFGHSILPILTRSSMPDMLLAIDLHIEAILTPPGTQ